MKQMRLINDAMLDQLIPMLKTHPLVNKYITAYWEDKSSLTFNILLKEGDIGEIKDTSYTWG